MRAATEPLGTGTYVVTLPNEFGMAKRDKEFSRYALTHNFQLEGAQVNICISFFCFAWAYYILVIYREDGVHRVKNEDLNFVPAHTATTEMTEIHGPGTNDWIINVKGEYWYVRLSTFVVKLLTGTSRKSYVVCE